MISLRNGVIEVCESVADMRNPPSPREESPSGLPPGAAECPYMTYDIAVVGGGIVGLATTRELKVRYPHL